jgi:hypothetical protein
MIGTGGQDFNWANDPEYVEIARCTYLFIGFKDATDCISSYRITHNNLDIGETSTATAQLESFLYIMMKPQCEKENKRNTHSLWENVHKHNPFVCGKYFSLCELYQASLLSRKLRVQFPVIIGFDDFLPFQNFTLFPSCVLGDLASIIRVSPDALVWCSCDPQHTILESVDVVPGLVTNTYNWNIPYYIVDFKYIADSIRCVSQQFNYDKRFTQLNVQGRAASNIIFKGDDPKAFQPAVYAGYDITIRADKIITWEANSIICGFALESSYKQALAQRFTIQPFIVPGKIVRIYNFQLHLHETD